MIKTISNWGNYPIVKGKEETFSSQKELENLLKSSDKSITRGKGRSYGDASLGSTMISTKAFNQILEFDPINGIINCESGVSLNQILELIIPKSWFLLISPGTKYVSIGGAIASDIHGKNHHKNGSFSNCIQSFEIMVEDGRVYNCSSKENEDLYNATIGGMGLTGVILTAKIKLLKVETSYITQQIKPCYNLKEMLEQINASSSSTYSVAWVDCFAKGEVGKGILFTGEHALKSEIKEVDKPLVVNQKQLFRVPFFFPKKILNPFTIRLFNRFYFWLNAQKRGGSLVGYNQFFYPLDSIIDWNKIYGRDGFVQYQFVVPQESSYESLTKILELIKEKGYGSFLSVLKLLGPKSGIISFPEPGYTLALDFPVCQAVFELIEELDEIVTNFGGKIYLAKDSCLKKGTFKKMYSRLDEFKQVQEKYNPQNKFQSSLSQRLNITK